MSPRHLSRPIDLAPIDWIAHLPEIGRPFERAVERWRELEKKYLEKLREAEEIHQWMSDLAQQTEEQIPELWTSGEIEQAKKANRDDPRNDSSIRTRAALEPQ